MSSIEANGVKLYYTKKGAGESVVLVHGVGGDYRTWTSQLNFLSQRFRVFTYSRRFSTPNQNEGDIHEDTVMNNTEDLVALIRELGISPVHLVSHSYGGFIATYFAYKHPELLKSLILIEPAVASVYLENPNSALQQFVLLFRHPSVAFATFRFMRNTVKPAIAALKRGDNNKAAKILVDGLQAKVGAFEQFSKEFQDIVVDNVRTIYDFEILGLTFKRSEIRQIKAPTFIIKGETSNMIIRSITDYVHRLIPNSEEITISGSGHFPMIERPEETNLKILDFLAKYRS